PVREPPKGEAGAPKISEFPGAVKGGGVVINVTIVNVQVQLISTYQVFQLRITYTSITKSYFQYIIDLENRKALFPDLFQKSRKQCNKNRK
ncbi:MAG: hypothetical protein KH357_15810, partial [Clostridiales bacterium]|nr:hypothetical protein [Clostridiales bacterium]